MIPKTIDQVAEADIQALITNAVAEGRTIEYKRKLPEGSDADRKEFLADISSFANTSGGDLLYGVDEQNGVPTNVTGLVMADQDLEIRRLESVITSGLDPRIRYVLRQVPCAAGPVLVIRVERSWIGPHRVVFKGHDKFYGRNAAGKYPLDVVELRNAFTLASGVSEKIRAFRIDRIINLNINVTPIPFIEGPKLVLHIIPVEAFAGNSQYDILQFEDDPRRVPLLGSSQWNTRINVEGLLTTTSNKGEPAFAYTQIYRNGIIEAVNGVLLNHEYEGRHVIPSIAYEKAPLQFLGKGFNLLQAIGVTPPIVVALTLTNVRGLEMGVDSRGWNDSSPIATDGLILPESWVEDFSRPVGKILKPMFDLVWNACGFKESRNFDTEGNWVARG